MATVAPDIVTYLQGCPRKRDVLQFPDSDAANAAAKQLRKQLAGEPVKVDASYDKVHLILQDGFVP